MRQLSECRDVLDLVEEIIVSHKDTAWLTIIDILEEEKEKVGDIKCSQPNCTFSLAETFEYAIKNIHKCRRGGTKIEEIVAKINKQQMLKRVVRLGEKIDRTEPAWEKIKLN